MKFYGVVEQMIPVADQIQIAWIKFQNLLLNIVPPGIAFDLDSLENINLGHGGKEWAPRKVIEMYKQRGDMAYRSLDKGTGERKHQVPITPLQNSITQEANNIVAMIQSFMGLLRDNIGFNEITDGSTPDPRMGKSVASMAYQSTSQALSSQIIAKKRINEELAADLTIRMQDAFASGEVEGYKKALGAATQQFWKVQSKLNLHEISLKIEDKPNPEQIQELNQKIQIALANKEITIADAVELDTFDNIKEKAAILAYKTKKNMDAAQARSLELQQQNGQIQQQSAMVAEEEKRKTMEVEFAYKSQLVILEKEWDYKIKELDGTIRLQDRNTAEQGRTTTKQIENQGKVVVKSMEMEKKENEK
jgi:hypothetical protein